MAKKGIFRQMAGDGETVGWKQPGIAFSPYVLLQYYQMITFLSVKGEVGSRVAHKQAQMGVNGLKIEFLGKWLEIA